ncbi:MAG: ABC transporter permease [Alphaproteobacteria bacterium]|nr:ABC transporter permease [Alphaproteobacteria bacterium]
MADVVRSAVDAATSAPARRIPGPRLRAALLASAPLVVLVALWELVYRAGIYSSVLLPAPSEVLHVFLTQQDELLKHTGASLARVVTGVSLSIVTAIPFGLLVGKYKLIDETTDWTIQIFRSFPPIALIPLAIMFFGIGDKPAIMLIWMASFWPLTISTIFGVKNVERTLLKVARAAHAGDGLVLRKILLPGAMPSILTGLRLAVGAGWLTVVTAEMMAVRSGLGYMIMYAQVTFHPDQILAGILIIGAIGLAFDQILRLVRKWLCRWQDGLVLDT